jgi:hypothetical protein
MGNAIIADVRCETCRYCQKKFGTPKCFIKKEFGETLPTSHWCAEYLPHPKDEYKFINR